MRREDGTVSATSTMRHLQLASGPTRSCAIGAVLHRQLRLPVWLVEVDVKGLCPFGVHSFLCDEAMVASVLASFMGQVHGTLGDPL